MKHLLIFLTFCLAVSAIPFSLPGPAGGADPFSPYIESFPHGKIDWDKGVIYGTGKGYLDHNGGSKNKALRAAQTLALQSILKIAARISVDDRDTIKTLGGGRFVIHLRAMIRYVEHETRFHEKGTRPYFEVIRRTPIKGVKGLTSEILTRLKTSPTARNNFPVPNKIAESEEEQEEWLILDTRNLARKDEIVPALFPKIVDTAGNLLYDIKQVDESTLRERGMARYVVSDRPLERLSSKNEEINRITEMVKKLIFPDVVMAGEKKKKRKKRKRFIVNEVKATRGLMKTNLVINEKDAKNLKKKDQSSRILKKCRVIIVLNAPTAGIEGSIENYRARVLNH